MICLEILILHLGDIGGQIGLFIGAGVMSYFEFVDCLLLVIYARFAQSFKTKPTAVWKTYGVKR